MKNGLLSQFYVPGESNPIESPLGINISLSELINFGIGALLLVAVLAALFFLLWGGITWITSGGNKEGLEKARKTIIYAVVGLVIVLLSFTLLNFVGSFFGIKLKTDNNDESSNTRKYDCPDKSNRYYCGDTSDTQCARCSDSPSCTGAESLISCTNTTSFCTEDIDCPVKQGGCPLGQKIVAYCVKGQYEERGYCATNCVDIDNFDQL